MRRGRHQVLYNFLPGEVIDYSDEKNIAKVVSWRTEQLHGVNRELLTELVSRRIRRFPSGSRGFPTAGTVDGYEVLTPRHVEVTLFPLSFECSKPDCGRVVRYSDLREFEAKTHRRYRCARCDGELQQFDLMHWHTCGWAEGMVVRRCPVHGDIWVVLNRNGSSAIKRWWFECKECNPAAPRLIGRVGAHCTRCGGKQRMRHGPFRQGEAFYPESLSMVDLGPFGSEGQSVQEADYETIITSYLGLLDSATATRFLRREVPPSEVDVETKAQKLIEDGIPKATVRRMLEAFGIRDLTHERQRAVRKMHEIIHLNPADLTEAATEVHEYQAVMGLDGLLSLEAAIQKGIENKDPTVEGIRAAPKKLQELGLSQAWVARDLPVLLASFGFSRGDPRKQKSILNAFPQGQYSKGKTPIYANRVLTEAIVLELDRGRLFRWLGRLGVGPGLPGVGSGMEEKAWLLNNFAPGAVEPFDDIPETAMATRAVYQLVHTLSHTLLTSASSFVGLDKNSMSELLFPSIPALVIYSNSSSDYQLGGMFTLFENQFSMWMDLAVEKARRCLYDPMCIQGKGACHACLYLAEISCEHSNRDLDRGVLMGTPDDRCPLGFWEKSL